MPKLGLDVGFQGESGSRSDIAKLSRMDPYRKSASRQWSSHSGHRPFPVSDVHSVSRLFGISVFKTVASQSHFQAANWYSALETKVASPTLSLENVVFLQSRKRF